jgi:beta-glucuronidase
MAMWPNTAQERLQTEQYGLSRALALMMAWNQHNRPSVILWGLQNESKIDPGGAAYKAWIKDMKNAHKAVDCAPRIVELEFHRIESQCPPQAAMCSDEAADSSLRH